MAAINTVTDLVKPMPASTDNNPVDLANYSAKHPADHSVDHSADHVADHGIDHSSEQPAAHSTDYIAEHSDADSALNKLGYTAENTQENTVDTSDTSAVDIVVDGVRITAKIGADRTRALLRDLAYAAADLASGKHARSTVQFYHQQDAWTLGLERVGDDVRITLFQAGNNPQVPLHDRPVKGLSLIHAITNAIDTTLTRHNVPRTNLQQITSEMRNRSRCCRDLEVARAFLANNKWQPLSTTPRSVDVQIDPEANAPIGFISKFSLRVHPYAPSTSDVERSDLHSLLIVGSVGVRVGDSFRNLGQHYPFLVAEALAAQTSKLVAAWESGVGWHHRRSIAGLTLGVRLTSSGQLDISFGAKKSQKTSDAITFPSVSVPDYVRAVHVYCRNVLLGIVRHDRTQRTNLRVHQLRDRIQEVSAALQRAVDREPKLNPSPESYHAFAASQPSVPPAKSWGHSKVRFQPSWQAIIPGIDLHAVFLYDDRLVATGSHELATIDNREGKLLWSAPIGRGITIPTPNSIVRVAPNGSLAVHDLATGEITMNTRISPRTSGMSRGAFIADPGLPKLIVLSEGQRYLTAVDSVCGEVRWRHALEHAGAFKVRRAGKLLIISCSSSSLCAIDVTSGELVWKIRDPARFSKPAAYRDNDLFVVSGDGSHLGRGRHNLHALDAWTGETKWIQPLSLEQKCVGAPLIHDEVVVLDQVDQRGRGFAAFRKCDGTPCWNLAPGFAPTASSWTVSQDNLVINSDNGLVAGIHLHDGTVKWRRIVACPSPADAPRNLEPVIKAGLAFVPQRTVLVMHPADGTQLGEIDADLVPDVIRVNDACGVVIVEESGHVAAYEAGARLTLLKG